MSMDRTEPSRPPLETGRTSTLSDHDRVLFEQFGRGPVETVPHGAIHLAIAGWAARTPDAIAAEHESETITYDELDRRADALARLLATHGVRPGDNVGLFMRRSIPMVVGILAILKAGAAYVPQDVRTAPPAQLRQVARTAGVRVILTLRGLADRVPAMDGRTVLAVDTDAAVPGTAASFVPERRAEPDDGCYVLFTSGTTGTPNGILVTHRNVTNILLTAPGNLGIRPGWRVAHLLNIAFDMAAWEILGCLANGATLVIRGRNIAAAAEKAEVVIATPSVLSTIDPARCHRTKVVAVAGEPCPRSLADRWAARCEFWNSCGPTETTIVNTMHRYDPASRRLTIGRPTPNNTVYVLDEHGQPCPIGVVGEMWAGGDCVSVGYLDNPELTAQRYAPDPFLGGDRRMFRTRDLGRWTADGQLEHWGRTDDQVKVRGFRVELDSVSSVLESVPGCRRAVTLKLDDRTLVAFVSPASVDPEAARCAVAAALPYYCVPSEVHALPDLPMTARGKVDKARLPALVARAAASAGPVLTAVAS